MKTVEATRAVDTFIRLLEEHFNFRIEPKVAPSHAHFRRACIAALDGSAAEVCPRNTNPTGRHGPGHLYAHPSWGTTDCVFCGKAQP